MYNLFLFKVKVLLLSVIMGIFEILMRPTVGTVMGPVVLAFLVGIIVGSTWNKFCATLGFCTVQLSTPASPSSAPPVSSSVNSSVTDQKEHLAITDEDLDHFCRLVEKTDGGPLWKEMMNRSTPNMSCQAWQRDPATGPPQYCSRTVYEDVTPEMVRDFFWDDEFRLKWDDMILHAAIIDECPTTGTMAVQWIRKFPFFCSDREYIIGRRIWESGRAYFCVTRGVPCPSVPRRQKPRRVDLYYSSWFIQAVASRRGDGERSACEVLLFHHEDMGIPWKLAKFGVNRAMWGTVQKIEAGLRAYKIERAGGLPISHAALMAQINTKIDRNHLTSTDGDSPQSNMGSLSEKRPDRKLQKLAIIGAILLLTCSIERGICGRTVLFGAAKRILLK